MDIVKDAKYISTLHVIKDKIKQSQYNALKSVNKELIDLYRSVGEVLSKVRLEKIWGNSFIVQLARDVSIDHPGLRGFSKTNLFNMINFYESYRQSEIFQALTGKLSWTHNVIILDR